MNTGTFVEEEDGAWLQILLDCRDEAFGRTGVAIAAACRPPDAAQLPLSERGFEQKVFDADGRAEPMRANASVAERRQCSIEFPGQASRRRAPEGTRGMGVGVVA